MTDTNIWKDAPEGTQFIIDYGDSSSYYKTSSDGVPICWNSTKQIWYCVGYDSVLDWKDDLPLFANVLTKPE